jgi:hypothetical protein
MIRLLVNILTLFVVIPVLSSEAVTSVYGQGFLEGDPRWFVRERWRDPISGDLTAISWVMRLGTRKTVAGVQYEEVEKSFGSDTSTWFRTDILLRESKDTVFAFVDGAESIWLINNLSLGQEYKHKGYCDLTVISKDTIRNPPLSNVVYSLDSPFDPKSLYQINMVGFRKGMFTGLCTVDGSIDELLCFQKYDSFIYKSDIDHPCILPDSIQTSVRDWLQKNKGEGTESGLWDFAYVVSRGDPVQIEFPSDVIRIYTYTGQLIRNPIKSESIVIDDPGMYVVQVEYNRGKSITGLIVVQ